METIGSYDAKTHLPALLMRVEKGDAFVITRRNIPVAMLSPVVRAPTELTFTLSRLRSLRAERKRSLGGYSINELKNEGRP